MDKEKHIEKHKELHNKLDELIADFIRETGGLPSTTGLIEFLEWSYIQTTNPTEKQDN